MAEFKTSRMSDLTPVSDVDDHAQAFEDSIVYAFGLPTGSTLTGKVFPGVDIDGNITGIVRSAAAPLPGSNTGPGWRSRDTDTGDEYLMMCVDGYLRIYQNTGSQTSPTWTERNKMNLTTGSWDVGTGGEGFAGCMVSDIYNDTFDHRVGGYVQWKTEDFDDNGYWSTGYRTRMILPATGRYRMFWSLFIGSPGDPEYFNNASIYAVLRKNGSSFIYDSNSGSGTKAIIDDSNPGVSVNGSWAGEFTAADYFELYAYTIGGGDYAGEIHSGHWLVERIE